MLKIVSYLESVFKFTLSSSYYSALVSELTIPELDQLLASDIKPHHKAFLQEQKDARQAASAAQVVARALIDEGTNHAVV